MNTLLPMSTFRLKPVEHTQIVHVELKEGSTERMIRVNRRSWPHPILSLRPKHWNRVIDYSHKHRTRLSRFKWSTLFKSLLPFRFRIKGPSLKKQQQTNKQTKQSSKDVRVCVHACACTCMRGRLGLHARVRACVCVCVCVCVVTSTRYFNPSTVDLVRTFTVNLASKHR